MGRNNFDTDQQSLLARSVYTNTCVVSIIFFLAFNIIVKKEQIWMVCSLFSKSLKLIDALHGVMRN